MLLITVGILQEDPKVAATVREQYRHFVVDEYQDVSPLQQRLLELWLGGRDDLCVVGDASQTIYSFTGASPKHLLGFKAMYPEAHVVKLIRDYRSTPQVVRLANDLLAGRRSGGPVADAAWATPLQLMAQRPAGPAPQFTECSDDEAEAATVAAQIRELLDAGTPASQVAVLFRTNGQSEAYEQALASAGIGYQLRGGERFFARKEVRDAILQLRAATRAVAETASARAARAAGPRHRRLAGLHRRGPHSGGALRERWESLAALVALADELVISRGPQFTLADFVNELQERSLAQHAPTVQGVTLASLHAAKGLEWDAVFLVGLSEGLMPISFADTPGGGGRGTPAPLRRRSPAPGNTSPVLVHRPDPGRARQPQALALPGRPAPRLRGQLHLGGKGAGAAPQGRRPGVVPGLRQHALQRRGTQGGPLQPVPAQLRGTDVRRAQAMAEGHRAGGRRPGVRGVHRRHTDRHRRGPARNRSNSWPNSPGWARPSWKSTARPS